MTTVFRRNLGLASAALFASSATLICCVLPAVMVAIGAGAALVGLVSAAPQLVWLSEHKTWVFSLAALMLAIAGLALWRARRLPCPANPEAARSCMRLRRISASLYIISLIAFAIGAAVAFLLPLLG